MLCCTANVHDYWSSFNDCCLHCSVYVAVFAYRIILQIVVFFSTCDAVDFHYALINEFKWSPSSLQEVKEQKFVSCTTFHLHGNMEHDNRRKAFQGFNVEKKALLLCTDVAARGLDIPKVRCIIQYDSPGEASEYVHRYWRYFLVVCYGINCQSLMYFDYPFFCRVGRTARLREKGEALLFLQPVEMDYLHDLQHHGVKLEEYQIQRCLDGFALHGKNFYKKSISLETHPWVLFLQKALETFISTEVIAVHLS